MRGFVATADDTRDGNFQDCVAGLMPVWCKRKGPMGNPGAPRLGCVMGCSPVLAGDFFWLCAEHKRLLNKYAAHCHLS